MFDTYWNFLLKIPRRLYTTLIFLFFLLAILIQIEYYITGNSSSKFILSVVFWLLSFFFIKSETISFLNELVFCSHMLPIFLRNIPDVFDYLPFISKNFFIPLFFFKFLVGFITFYSFILCWVYTKYDNSTTLFFYNESLFFIKWYNRLLGCFIFFYFLFNNFFYVFSFFYMFLKEWIKILYFNKYKFLGNDLKLDIEHLYIKNNDILYFQTRTGSITTDFIPDNLFTIRLIDLICATILIITFLFYIYTLILEFLQLFRFLKNRLIFSKFFQFLSKYLVSTLFLFFIWILDCIILFFYLMPNLIPIFLVLAFYYILIFICSIRKYLNGSNLPF